MENPLRGAAVAAGIVQHALLHAKRAEQLRGEGVLAHRQRQRARHAGAVQHERFWRQLGRQHDFLEIVVDEILDALIGGAEVIGEHAVRLAVMREHGGEQIIHARVRRGARRRQAEHGELEVDVLQQAAVGERVLCAGKAEGWVQFHSDGRGVAANPGSRRAA